MSLKLTCRPDLAGERSVGDRAGCAGCAGGAGYPPAATPHSMPHAAALALLRFWNVNGQVLAAARVPASIVSRHSDAVRTGITRHMLVFGYFQLYYHLLPSNGEGMQCETWLYRGRAGCGQSIKGLPCLGIVLQIRHETARATHPATRALPALH